MRNKLMHDWKHLFKLDPAKQLTDDQVRRVCESGTDGIIVGGTDEVTLAGIKRLLAQLTPHNVPLILEVSEMDAITLGFDYYFIPSVLNSQDKKWIMDIQHQAIKRHRNLLPYAPPLYLEGYCIMNEDAKAYQKTQCYLPSEEDVIAYAYMAEHLFHLPIFYLEYSGMYGDAKLVKQVKETLDDTLLFYGGGIADEIQAAEMSAYADVIIVGNSLYTDFASALKTVSAVN